MADVVLGFDTAGEYLHGSGCLGATVGRNANRVGGSCLPVGNRRVRLTPNEGPNNLHSGPEYWFHRMWMVDRLTESAITLALETPEGDQGMVLWFSLFFLMMADSMGMPWLSQPGT